MVLAGNGSNGGGALVCARRLHNWGAQVRVFLSRPDSELTPIPAHQLDTLLRMRVTVAQADATDETGDCDLVVDGVIGYGLSGAPHGTAGKLIQWANSQEAPVVALDAPSGVDTTTGKAFDPAVRATATLTLALPKEGLRASGGRRARGRALSGRHKRAAVPVRLAGPRSRRRAAFREERRTPAALSWGKDIQPRFRSIDRTLL